MFSKIFTKYLSFLLIPLFGLCFILNYLFGNEQSFGINKTVGWAYDFSNQVFYNAILLPISLKLFVIGYFVIFIIRRKTNLYLSIFHFGVIIISIISSIIGYYSVGNTLCLLSLFIFFFNIIKTYK